jgi:cyclophilin family peptidyl-prolyl cis-trans isomerase/endonuclease/exonuclease/phosphatase family metal-dependent hydrolase
MPNIINKQLIAICILLLSSIGGATADIDINILLLNTEFFFDNEAPHGGVVGDSRPVPTAEAYRAEAKAIAELIDAHGANIVGLVEVENRAVVEAVKSNLQTPDAWEIAFDEGRDTFTEQDVALLTKFQVVSGSATNFPDEREIYFEGEAEKDVNPSKILGVELRVDTEPVYILLTHLISRRGQNNAKRLAQATVVRRKAVKAMLDEKHVIVMGDINDTPGTPVLQRLRGFGDIWGKMIQTANSVEPSQRFTHIHEGQKNLLDHILISPSLRDEFLAVPEIERCEIIDAANISDHRAVLTRLRIVQPVVVMETNKGTIELELYPNVAPKTVANFIKLIEMEFYDGLTFHRYEENFVIQGGDPLGNGTGGPGWSVEGEFGNPKLRAKMPRHRKGVLAMARSRDPDSAGSQFYICLDTNASRYFSLNGQYTTFGRVITGLDVVEEIRKGDSMTTVRMKGQNGD